MGLSKAKGKKMKYFILLLCFSLNALADETCASIKSCTDWASSKTGIIYELEGHENVSLNFNTLSINAGNPNFILNYLLHDSGYLRVKKNDKVYRILSFTSLQNENVQKMPNENMPVMLDFYARDILNFSKDNKESAQVIIKKYLSKNGRIAEVKDTGVITIIDDDLHIRIIQNMVNHFTEGSFNP